MTRADILAEEVEVAMEGGPVVHWLPMLKPRIAACGSFMGRGSMYTVSTHPSRNKLGDPACLLCRRAYEATHGTR